MKIVFMGTPDFAEEVAGALAAAGHEIVLVVTQPDKPKGRGKKNQEPPMKRWAKERGIGVFQPPKIRDAEAVARLRETAADIFVVAAFGQILPKEILEMPPFGCVNVHASLLPKYRGASPIQWAVINGDESSGVTTMQMGVGLDDGDILLQKEVRLAPDETGGTLFEKLAKAGGTLCVETLAALENGGIAPRPQDEAQATHVGMITKRMGLLDFSRSAAELERLIRGLDPWPCAFTCLNGRTLKIWKADVWETLPGRKDAPLPPPGTVALVNGGIFCAAADGYLRLREVQLEGRKRMAAADFLRGCRINEGCRLGDGTAAEREV